METTRENLTNLNTKWIENLALEEINMDETGIVNFNNHVDPTLELEEASIELMEEIQELFEVYVTKFNHLRNDFTNNKSIKMFKISNTVNDFMLFRNSLKLIISRTASDVISLGFVSNSSGYYPARTSTNPTSSENTTHEIRAKMGPFNEVQWTFQGEAVNVTTLVKYYLTEFIRQSAQ